MAQTYITPSRACSSPEPVHTTTQERIETSNTVEDIQGAYIELKDRLVGAIDATRSILTDIKSFNRDSWIVRYPHFNQSPSSTTSTTDDKVKPSRPIRRSLSFADDPSSSRDVLVHPGFHRSMTLADVPEAEETVGSDEPKPETLIPASTDFQVLRLDLKLGHSGASSAASLMTQLEKSSIANLLDDRINASMSHVEKLRTRVEDTSSKVLVTGDLNAGKSTFVNALLRREVLPVDQQPCTAMFCEVHDAADNEGVEEVHLIKEGAAYNIKDESTFTRAKIADLENIVSEAENAQHILKIYVSDARSPTESLLSNGVVDIALIDAPGLNRDSIKTTALFARQEEIDVVVFVVSAENHFTLSAKEFLWNASNEKAYLFIVVNRFDSIKDKARCKRVVLEQIKQLSPRTYEEADDLVHFVDSNSALHANGVDGSFENLESALRSFVLVKRSKSKFAPVTNYLDNLHSDVSLLASSNALLAQSESEQARADLERVKPVLEKMKKNRDGLEDGLETVEERGSSKARRRTQERLNSALENIGKGQLVEGDKSTLPSYPGILGVWEYAKEVRKTLLASLDLSVKLAEDEARAITTEGVNKITDMAETFLPEGVERSRRVFMPQAMFSPRKNKSGGRRYSGAGSIVVAGGVHGLGIGLAQRTDLLEVSFFDIFDAPHHLSVHLNQNGKSSTALTHLGGESGALSVASLGLGALTVAGGKALGARGLIEGVVRIGDLFGNETVRKWAAPVLGAFTIGLTVYLVYELPHNIPRTVGRRIKASLVQHEVEEENEDLKFVNSHCLRVGRETRKVLRLAGWDLKERFRSAMEERSKEVKGKEEMQKRAEKALEFFEGVSERSKTVIESIHA